MNRKATVGYCFATIMLVAFLGWWLLLSGNVLRTHQQNGSNRKDVLRIRAALQIGVTREVVRSAIRSIQPSELRFIEDSPALWRLTMPLESGDNHWIMLIEFQNALVESVRIRNGDGARPVDAPED